MWLSVSRFARRRRRPRVPRLATARSTHDACVTNTALLAQREASSGSKVWDLCTTTVRGVHAARRSACLPRYSAALSGASLACVSHFQKPMKETSSGQSSERARRSSFSWCVLPVRGAPAATTTVWHGGAAAARGEAAAASSARAASRASESDSGEAEARGAPALHESRSSAAQRSRSIDMPLAFGAAGVRPEA